MITVEDLLKGLGSLVVSRRINDRWHSDFIASVQNHVTMGNALSSNQGAIILKVASKNTTDLAAVMRRPIIEVTAAISSPIYRKPPYQSISIKREVRYLGSNKLAFRFKLDSMVVADLKSLKSVVDIIQTPPKFDPEYRLWIVPVTATTFEKTFNIIRRHKFDFDQGVLEYMTLCTNSKTTKSMFVVDESEPENIYVNVCNNPILAYAITGVMNGEEL